MVTQGKITNSCKSLSFSCVGLVGYTPMDELVEDFVVGVGVNLTLVRAELTPSHVMGNALHAIQSVQGYATGKNYLSVMYHPLILLKH